MRSMIVSGALAIGNGLDPAPLKDDVVDLAAGAITVSRSDTDELVRYAAAADVFNSAFSPSTRLQIIQGLGNGNALLSPIINPHTATIHKQTVIAPAAKVVHLGRNQVPAGTWTLGDPADNIGRYATIRVENMSADIHVTGASNNQFTVDYLIKRGDTEATVHAALLLKLQKAAGKFYASVAGASGGGNFGFAFTGKIGVNFKVSGEDLLHGSPITVQTAYNPGRGLGSVLAIDEKNFATHRGFNNSYHLSNELNDHSLLFINPATNYVVYTIKWTNPNKHVLAAGDDPFIVETQVCVPSTAAATITQMDALIAAIADQSVAFV